MWVNCPICKKDFNARIGDFNRAKSLGYDVTCGIVCGGIRRRGNKSSEQKKSEKSEYDKLYRAKNISIIKERKKAYFQKMYDPIKAAEYRKSRMHKHIEYCRQPEYKKWKIEYDRGHRAKKHYGEFWECAILVEQIDSHIIKIADKNHLRTINGTLNKSTRRKKQWLRLMKNLPQLT